MTLLLGPPSSGKTTLMLALAGKLDKKLKVRIDIICILLFRQFNSLLFKMKTWHLTCSNVHVQGSYYIASNKNASVFFFKMIYKSISIFVVKQ